MEWGNQPVFTPPEEERDDHNLNNRPSGADGDGWNLGAYSFEDDIMSLPFISMSNDQFPGREVQDDCHSYTPDLNSVPYSMIDKNWINMKSDLSESCTDNEMLPSELCMRGDGADSLMSPAANSVDYGKSEITTNYTPPKCETGTGYPIKIHGAEAQNSRASRLQLSGKLSSECNASLLPLVDNFGARGNNDDIDIVSLSSNAPQKVDRNYLTLGLGDGKIFRPNSNFSTHEISNKLQEISSPCSNPIIGSCPKNINSLTQVVGVDAGGLSRPDSNFSKIPSKSQEVSSHFNNSGIGHFPKNRSSLTQMSYGDARIQTNTGNLSISNSNLSAYEIANKHEGVSFQYNNSIVGHYPKNPSNSSNLTQLAGGIGRIQINAGELQRPAYNLATRMPNCVEDELIRDTGFRQNFIPFPASHTLQTNIPSITPSRYYASVSESTPVSLRPPGSTLFSETNCGSQPNVASTSLASHPISWQQGYSRKNSMNISSESSRNYLSHRHKQNSTSHLHPANHSSTAEVIRTEGDLNGSFLSSVQPVGGQFDTFHKTSPNEAPMNFIYPERIGGQFSKSSTNQSATTDGFPKRLGLQANDFATARNIRGQFQHGMPTQSSAVFPRVDNSSGQVVPVAKLNVRPQVAPNISRPPLKRKAVVNPSALSVSAQRRKIFPLPVVSDSTPRQRQNIPSIPAAGYIPPASLHIKWKGFEGAAPEPLGKRCLLCKRDLSYTAEGLMYQPTAPPPVAVLPCGHTFHDHCLQVITPQDQLKNPPCIPCAVGET